MTTKNETINPDHEAAMEMARALDRNGDVIPDAMAIIRDDCINLARAYLALLSRSPTGLTEWVPGGGQLWSLLWDGKNWQAMLEYHSDKHEQYLWQGTGPTPEDAVKDAAGKVKP